MKAMNAATVGKRKQQPEPTQDGAVGGRREQRPPGDVQEDVFVLGPPPRHIVALATRDFLTSVLPDRGIYFIATPRDRGFVHIACSTIAEMVEQALALDADQQNVYFACASFARESYVDGNGKTRRRTQENAGWARSFWIDVDCGEEKAAKGFGYATSRDAVLALRAFMRATELPAPTVVLSGGGLHCYWPLTTTIEKAEWTAVARNLKRLLAGNNPPLLADAARTADIASVLRPVGTHNWKPERDGAAVALLREAPPITFVEFKQRVESALFRADGTSTPPNYADDSAALLPPLTLEQLEDALRHIEPDCPRPDWWRVIAATVDEYRESSRPVLQRWSAGTLHNKVAVEYDEREFKRQFDDALKRVDRAGERVTMGFVVTKARNGGWVDPRKEGTLPDWIARLNREYAWVERNASIYRLAYGDFIEPAKFRTQFDNQLVSAGGKSKPLPMGTAWLKHPARRSHDQLVIRPDEGLVTKDNCLNRWSGFAIHPVKGNIRPFVRLLRRLIPERLARKYVLRWLAHLIQRPAIKMHVCLAVWSHAQGVGKNLLFEAISTLIGPNHATLISQGDLTGNFNGWADRRVFVIGDEVSGNDKRPEADKLKGLITGLQLRINEKYQPAFDVPNLLNFVFLSNHNDAVFLDDHDRRYFVWEIRAGPLDSATATSFVQWRDNGGIAAVRYLLEHVDISGFDPKAPAPLTAAKRQMIEDSRSDLEVWMADLMGPNVAHLLGREVVTSSELARRYSADTGRAVPAAKTVVSTCKKLGAYATQVRLANGRKVRACVFRTNVTGDSD